MNAIGPFRPVGDKFPVFPVEPGIPSIFSTNLPSGRENGEANQALASQFPSGAGREFAPAQQGIKYAELGIIPNGRGPKTEPERETHSSAPLTYDKT
jgi:hypothetical protein